MFRPILISGNFLRSGCTLASTANRWLSQLFWNFLNWEDICQYLALCLVLGIDYQVGAEMNGWVDAVSRWVDFAWQQQLFFHRFTFASLSWDIWRKRFSLTFKIKIWSCFCRRNHCEGFTSRIICLICSIWRNVTEAPSCLSCQTFTFRNNSIRKRLTDFRTAAE